eukprot:TRINITY_DN10422_c0_g1_i1.p1 TRINITY_DN10422_c0_g1~~TRINITY_DN10422_c0_g1_i1.p1  ORF type:complete len:474 (-),score=174.87 TRINITY_DN10422_c0_g1_i1:82-1503(-)
MESLLSEPSQWVKLLIPPVFAEMNAWNLLVDAFLLVFCLYVLFRKPQTQTEKPLTEKEIEEVINNWKPLPLIMNRTPLMELDDNSPVIESSTTTHVVVNGKEVLHMSRNNFLGMVNNKRVEDATIKTLRKYGTGTCGPRGFNGTIDTHLQLETRIRDFLKVHDCCIYSYGFATVSSSIPAFASRGDILVVDKGVNYSLLTGVKLSRSDVEWFEHNDMEDLERVLKKIQKDDQKSKKKLTRRYIIVEGLYLNYGDVTPLDQIVKLKEKYCYRLMLDDSFGLGVLGKTGRGTCEHFGIDPKQVDMLTGTLEGSTSSVGGFCCGEKNVVYHQRLNSSGYVYSCSLPPLLASASIEAINILDEDSSLPSQLQKNTSTFVKSFSSPHLKITSASNSPLVHLRLAKPSNDRYADEKLLQQVVDLSLENGVLLTRSKYVHNNEKFLPPPSIRIAISAAHTKKDLSLVTEAIQKAVSQVFA